VAGDPTGAAAEADQPAEAAAPQQREPLPVPELPVQSRAPEQLRVPVLLLAVLQEHRRQAASPALLQEELRQAA
jgi:hypothetical protein